MSDTHFAVIDKSGYQRVFQKLEELALNEKIDFLKRMDFFAHWSRSSVAKLTLFLQPREFRRNHVVCREGEECRAVYMVTRGEFEVTKTKENKGKMRCALAGPGIVIADIDVILGRPH